MPEHTDIFSQGYVGYTSKTTEERWKGHIKESKNTRNNYPIYNAIRKYKELIVVETIVVGDCDYCLEFEYKLRPAAKIGWNIQAGGNRGCDPSCFTAEVKAKISSKIKGRKFSEEHKRKIAFANSKRTYSKEYCEKMSKARVGIKRSLTSRVSQSQTLKTQPWRNRSACKEVWLIADIIFKVFLADFSIGATKLANNFKLGETKLVAMLKKFRNGWNPNEDVEWLKFKEQYSKELLLCQHTA